MNFKWNNIIFILFWLVSNYSCQNSRNVVSESTSNYPRMIGDISYDSRLDNSNFKLCNTDNDVAQYYRFNGKPYINEKEDLVKTILHKYDNSIVKKENGLVRIRFIINCKGEAGRFRLLAADFNYKEKVFDSNITSQLLHIIESIETWKVVYKEGVGVDYYFYLIFKIEGGEIKEILP